MIKLDELEFQLEMIPREDWNRLFSLIEIIENASKKDVEMSVESFPVGEHQMVNFENGRITRDFIRLVVDLRLAPNFDYSDWMKEHYDPLLKGTADVSKADAVTICKCFAVMLRGERYMDGYIADQMRNGFVLQLLKTLKTIVRP